MATTPTAQALIERFFQEYANASEILKILVDVHEPITQQGQLITLKYLSDHYMLKGSVTTPDLTGVEMQVHKNTANGYAGLDANAKVPGTQLSVIDNLGSHDIHALLSANQGRVLNEELATKVSLAHLSDYELLAHKGAASGYTPLDANTKVPAQYLPASIANAHHIFATQALMLSSGSSILQGEMVLVHGDPSPDNNGEYVALQNSPSALNHYDHLGYHVRQHRHPGSDIDVTLDGHNVHLDAAITSMDGATDAVKVTADKAKADIAAHLANSSSAHTVGAISGLSGPLAQVVTNTGHIATNTATAAAAKAAAAKAESDLHNHIINAVDAHDYTAIAGIEHVFDDRLKGYKTNGDLESATNLDVLIDNGDYFIQKTANGMPSIPNNISWFIAKVRSHNRSYVKQELVGFQASPLPNFHCERRSSDGGASWDDWIGNTVYSGTVAPSGGINGDLYIQHA